MKKGVLIDKRGGKSRSVSFDLSPNSVAYLSLGGVNSLSVRLNAERVINDSEVVYSLGRVGSSVSETSVLDDEPSVSAFDDGVNPHVESLERGRVSLEPGACRVVRVQVGGLSEEVGAEALVRVVQDLEHVRVRERLAILASQLHVPGEVT